MQHSKKTTCRFPPTSPVSVVSQRTFATLRDTGSHATARRCLKCDPASEPGFDVDPGAAEKDSRFPFPMHVVLY